MGLRKRISEITARILNHLTAVKAEMEKDMLDLAEQVIVLTLGGILGGQAFAITRADAALWAELVSFFFILAIGMFTLGIIHFTISHTRVLGED